MKKHFAVLTLVAPVLIGPGVAAHGVSSEGAAGVKQHLSVAYRHSHRHRDHAVDRYAERRCHDGTCYNRFWSRYYYGGFGLVPGRL